MACEPESPVVKLRDRVVVRRKRPCSAALRRSTVDGSSQGARVAAGSAATEETAVSALLRRSPSRPPGQPIRRTATLPETAGLRPLSPSAVGLHASRRTATAQLAACERFAAWQRRQSAEATPGSPGGRALIREVAAKHGLPESKVSLYKDAFDKFDTNKSAAIEFEEFCKILDCVNGSSLKKLAAVSYDEVWRRADRGSNGAMGFEDFVLFYQQYFYKTQRGVSIFAGVQGCGDYDRVTGGGVYDAATPSG